MDDDPLLDAITNLVLGLIVAAAIIIVLITWTSVDPSLR